MSEPFDSEAVPAARRGGKFQPGESGNLKGRPRKSTTADQSMLKAFDAKVTVTDGGKRRKITKRDATATQIANKSASGDLRASKLALDFVQKAEDRRAAAPASVSLTATDEDIVQRFIARLALIAKDAA